MVLNPALFDGLRAFFGSVRIVQENVQLKWEWRKNLKTDKNEIKITQGGEQYYVNCPVCGDRRGRLAFGHRFLTPLDRLLAPNILTRTFKCYNEDCDIREHRCFQFLKDYVAKHQALIGVAVQRAGSRGPQAPTQAAAVHLELPKSFVRLDALDPLHPAHDFVRRKYGFDPMYLAQAYGVGFCGSADPLYPKAVNRIIFPAYEAGELRFWQGRTILGPGPANPRWYIPHGARKVVANVDRIAAGDVIVIAEGFPAAIACGPTGAAIFGKDLDAGRASQIATKFRTAVIALDPETQIPDPRTRRKKGVGYDPNDNGRIFAKEICEKLVEAGMKIPPYVVQYPPEVMARAKEVFERKRAIMDGVLPDEEFDDSIPDPADLGMAAMQVILRHAPPSHRSAYLC